LYVSISAARTTCIGRQISDLRTGLLSASLQPVAFLRISNDAVAVLRPWCYLHRFECLVVLLCWSFSALFSPNLTNLLTYSYHYIFLHLAKGEYTWAPRIQHLSQCPAHTHTQMFIYANKKNTCTTIDSTVVTWYRSECGVNRMQSFSHRPTAQCYSISSLTKFLPRLPTFLPSTSVSILTTLPYCIFDITISFLHRLSPAAQDADSSSNIP
jgi:hypothetical protein